MKERSILSDLIESYGILMAAEMGTSGALVQ